MSSLALLLLLQAAPQGGWQLRAGDIADAARSIVRKHGTAVVALDCPDRSTGRWITATDPKEVIKEVARAGLETDESLQALWPKAYPPRTYRPRLARWEPFSTPYSGKRLDQVEVQDGKVGWKGEEEGLPLSVKAIARAKWAKPLEVDAYLERFSVRTFGPPVSETEWLQRVALAIGAEFKDGDEGYELRVRPEEFRKRATAHWQRDLAYIHKYEEVDKWITVSKAEICIVAIPKLSDNTIRNALTISLSGSPRRFANTFKPGSEVHRLTSIFVKRLQQSWPEQFAKYDDCDELVRFVVEPDGRPSIVLRSRDGKIEYELP